MCQRKAGQIVFNRAVTSHDSQLGFHCLLLYYLSRIVSEIKSNVLKSHWLDYKVRCNQVIMKISGDFLYVCGRKQTLTGRCFVFFSSWYNIVKRISWNSGATWSRRVKRIDKLLVRLAAVFTRHAPVQHWHQVTATFTSSLHVKAWVLPLHRFTWTNMPFPLLVSSPRLQPLSHLEPGVSWTPCWDRLRHLLQNTATICSCPGSTASVYDRTRFNKTRFPSHVWLRFIKDTSFK